MVRKTYAAMGTSMGTSGHMDKTNEKHALDSEMRLETQSETGSITARWQRT